MSTAPSLFLFTISFPNEDGEPFLANEFPFLEKYFSNIHIITSSQKSNSNKLDSKTTIHRVWDILKGKKRLNYFIKNIGLILKVIRIEFCNCRSKSFFLQNLRSHTNAVINSCIYSDYLYKLGNFNRKAVFYSFWMNDHALTLSVMKMQNRIDSFVFRVHGYDLILERWPHNYIAFQATCHKYADTIYTVSKKSLEYFQKTYSNSKNAKYSYLGVTDKGINPYKFSDQITIVSCSNIIPLKRINLIIDICKKVKGNLNWIHFGEGSLKENYINQCKSLPANVKTEFKGQVTQAELFDFYNKESIDFFINVSDSEGLPFTIIEAISFGIPVLATNVGGTSEIVNTKTGLLLDENFKVDDIVALLDQTEGNKYRNDTFRKGVREFWEENFNAAKIYPAFIEKELIYEAEV